MTESLFWRLGQLLMDVGGTSSPTDGCECIYLYNWAGELIQFLLS